MGGGGGAPDAGSGPSIREFPHGGADACTPRQGVTLLYGPSICTRSVQMDLRRNQVRRPLPTPGSGTLWVSGESLRDRRVSCLPRWTVCPTRSPSQDTNRSTCRGECSLSGPLATPPGRCHHGPLANGPGCNPPYCLRSGGAETDTGGAPKPLRSGTSPASLAGSCHPGLPPCAAVLVPASPLTSPGVSPFPLAALPGFCRVTSVSAVRPCSGALACFVFFFFLLLVSPPGVSVCPLPLPMYPRRLLAVLAPFLGGRGRWGWGGGGRPRCLPSGVSTSRAWRRHEAQHLPLCRGGGGLPCGPRRRPSYPAFAPPVFSPLGLARRVLPSGMVEWSVPHPLSAASPPCRFVLGGGGGASRFPLPSSPTLGGAEVCGGGGRPCRLSLVARKSQAGRKHSAGMRRGTCPSAGRGGGLPCGSRRRPSYPAFAPPVVPPFGLARCVFPTGTAVWSVPHPLSAASPPCRFVLGEGGGRFPPPPSFTPHPWGGGGVWEGGGAPLSPFPRSTQVAGRTQAQRRHEARHLTLRREGGGLAVWLPSSPFLPCVRTPSGPPVWACTVRVPYGHGRVVRPAPSLRCLPTLPLCPRGGGGALSAPPLPSPPTLGGAEVCGRGGGGGPCRLPFVARMPQA